MAMVKTNSDSASPVSRRRHSRPGRGVAERDQAEDRQDDRDDLVHQGSRRRASAALNSAPKIMISATRYMKKMAVTTLASPA